MQSSQVFIGPNTDDQVIPGRFLTHVSSDKPFYWPGEVMFIEAFVIDAFTKYPAAGFSQGVEAQATIINHDSVVVFRS